MRPSAPSVSHCIRHVTHDRRLDLILFAPPCASPFSSRPACHRALPTYTTPCLPGASLLQRAPRAVLGRAATTCFPAHYCLDPLPPLHSIAHPPYTCSLSRSARAAAPAARQRLPALAGPALPVLPPRRPAQQHWTMPTPHFPVPRRVPLCLLLYRLPAFWRPYACQLDYVESPLPSACPACPNADTHCMHFRARRAAL